MSRHALLAIGPLRSSGGYVSGQKMMFQLSVDSLRGQGWDVRVVDLSEPARSAAPRRAGGFSFRRALQFAAILVRCWARLLGGGRRVVYLTIASSTPGFLRDLAIVWPAYWLGRRVVCHHFGGHYRAFYDASGPRLRRLVRATLGRAAAVLVEGEAIRDQLDFVPDARVRVRVLVNGLPQEGDFPAHGKSLAPGEPFRVLYLSNMIETKGYWDVLTAVEFLRSRGRAVEALFVGRFLASGDDRLFAGPTEAREAFLRRLAQPPLAGGVRYVEQLLGPEKAEAFSAAHAFVLPSGYIFEGQPVSVLEAMAHGVVTLATRYRLIPLMLEENVTGYFVPYGDPEAIANRIELLIDRPDEYRRLSEGAVLRFRRTFSRERYATRLGKLLAAIATP